MANELSHELLGGLNAVNQGAAPQPQQQQGGLNPVLAAQTSSVAQAADIKNTELASVNEQMRAAQSMIMPMLRRSIADQAGYEQTAKDMWARLEQTLAPRQYDTGQYLSDIARGAKGSSLVDVLSNMSSAASTGRQAFDENELKKAEYMQKMGQARADTNEKRIFDLWGKMQGKGSMATKVAGTIIDKAKDAANQKVKDFVGNRTIEERNADWDNAYRNSINLMLPTYLMGVDRETADEILSNLAGLESRLGRPTAAAAQAVPQPQPAAASPQQRIDLPAIEDKGAGFDFDTSKWRPEDAETVRRTAVRYQANPSYGTQEALNAALSAAMRNSGGQPAPAIEQPARGMTANEIKAQGSGGVQEEKERFKNLAEYEKNLTAANDSANTMLRNIGHLETEARKANFGAGAGAKTQVLKWADTFGVALDPRDREAMNANQVMGKIALQLATIGAKNISSRPTQLEFQKLLEEGVPATGMSAEAFNRVLGLFKETSQAEQAQLSEFMKFKHNTPKGAVSVGDFSDYWALRHDPRYATISIQDVLDTMKERGMTFNQVISKLRERK